MIACRISALIVSFVGVSTAGGACAADLPVLKSGLWEVSRVSTGVAKEMCTQNDRRVEGNRMTVKATCKLGPTTMKTESVMVFSGNSAYHTDAIASYDPPFMNISESKSTIDGKWTGPCNPGQQPGDIVTETGQTINMKAMMKK
jgi:hypothetical protein